MFYGLSLKRNQRDNHKLKINNDREGEGFMMQVAFDFFNDEAVLFDAKVTSKLEPEKMTLSAFLSDPKWHAFPDPKATGESKGMYRLSRPDGKEWRGGWIGKFKSEEQAKRSFHESQVRMALHWNAEISEIILGEYPYLLRAHRSIHELMKTIHIGSGPYIRIDINGVNKYFHVLDFPMYCRVSVRTFAHDFNLVQLQSGEPRYGGNSYFDSTENMSIALERVLSSILPDRHLPHFLHSDFDDIKDGDEVVFRVPVEIDNNGFCTKYKELEGKKVFSHYGSPTRIRYNESDEISLHPSMLLARLSGNYWTEYTPL
jgi:hypothetical protein